MLKIINSIIGKQNPGQIDDWREIKEIASIAPP
jgi:hypothetical protein